MEQPRPPQMFRRVGQCGRRIELGVVALLVVGMLSVASVSAQQSASRGLDRGWKRIASVEIQGWAVRGDRIFAASTVGSAVEIDPATGQLSRLDVIAKSDAIPAQFGIEAMPARPILEDTPAVAIAPNGFILLAGGYDEGSPDSTLLLSTDGGQTWDRPDGFPLGNMFGAVFTSEAGIVVGRIGAILRTPDNGRSWRQVRSGTRVDLAAVTGLPSGLLIAVGDRGVVLRSPDHGRTWSRHVVGSVPLHAVAVSESGIVVVATGASGTVIKSTDGGRVFKIERIPGTGRLPAIRSVVLVPDRGRIAEVFGTDDGRVLRRSPDGTWSETRLDHGRIHRLLVVGMRIVASSSTGALYCTSAATP